MYMYTRIKRFLLIGKCLIYVDFYGDPAIDCEIDRKMERKK